MKVFLILGRADNKIHQKTLYPRESKGLDWVQNQAHLDDTLLMVRAGKGSDRECYLPGFLHTVL